MRNKKAFSAIALAPILTLSVVFSWPFAASAQDFENFALARRVVEQGQFHKMAALGMRLSARRAVVDGKAPQEFLECISAVEPGIFSSPITSIYADNLTAIELADMLRFFESGAGQKYISYTLWGTEKLAGFAPATRATTVTINEKKSIDAFISSPVGKQLSWTASPFAIATQREIAKVVGPIVSKCGPGPEAVKPPSAGGVGPGYISALARKIKGNINYARNINKIEGNPEATYRIVQLPTGEVASVEKIGSSGMPDWDAAVEKAIYISSPLPRNIDGTVERVIDVHFFMKDGRHEK